MECKFTLSWMFIALLVMKLQYNSVAGAPQVPCLFIFGDSLYDDGNNNNLPTIAKVNYPPYGIDFSQGPTGRFSNGLTQGDFIAQFLGFEQFIPPFAMATGPEIMRGVTYASGAAGILDETGQNQGARVTMNQQLLNHNITILRFIQMLGTRKAAMDLLGKCIYTCNMGNNDFLNNYFLPFFYPTSRLYTPDQFAQLLNETYSRQLQLLYDYGARKVAVIGVGLIGCVPRILATFEKNASGCVDKVNNAAQLFNDRLISLVNQFNANRPEAKFTYINSMGIGSGDPTPLGFKVLNESCCPVASGFDTCKPYRTPCANRSEYVYWDFVHPTEGIDMLFAERAYKALLPTDAVPYDISTLAQS